MFNPLEKARRLREYTPVSETLRQELCEAADMIELLWMKLNRSNKHCENIDHLPHEYHKKGPCPIQQWLEEGFDELSIKRYNKTNSASQYSLASFREDAL